MYILIDADKMRFLRKHQDAFALSNLVYIECNDCATKIVACDEPLDFDGFTDLELKLLYKNTTGEEYKGFARDPMLCIVHELTTRMSEFVADKYQLALQAAYISEDDDSGYQFVPGAVKPAPVADLFEYTVLRVRRNPVSEQLALITPLKRSKTLPALFPPLAPSTPRPAAVRSASTPPSAPAKGSVLDRINSKAETMWTAAGKPTNPAAVKELRKQIVEQLVADGINQNSAGKGASLWLKGNVNP